VKRVFISMVLVVLAGAQAPLPPLPDLPMPPSPLQGPAPDLKGLNIPGPPEMKAPPAPENKGFEIPGPKDMSKPAPQALENKGFEMPGPKDMNKPAPLVPVNPNSGSANMPKGGVPTYGNDTVKPPPFKLIDNNPTPTYPAPSGPPMKSPGPILQPSEGPFLTPPPSGAVVEPLPTGSVTTPCLSLARTGPAGIKAGQTFSYEIVVRNVGNVFAPQARLEEDLPPGTRFLSSQPMATTLGDRLSWSVDNLAPGAERRFKVEVESSRDGEWKARATLSTSVTVGSQTTVMGAPAQAIIMTGPSSVPVGHSVQFQIRVTNTTSATLTEPTLRVQLPPGLHHLQGEAIEAPLGELAPGQFREITLEVIALQVGKLSADATLLSKSAVMATTRTMVIATEQPILMLRQTGQLAPVVGSEVEYKLEVTNRSGGEVKDVIMMDELPEGLVLAGSNAGAQYDQATRTLRWNIGTLPPGQSRQAVFRAQVRGTGPQINKLSARATGVAEVQLQTILRMGGGAK